MSGTKKHRPSTQDGQSLHFADIAGKSSGATTGSAAGESSGATTGSAAGESSEAITGSAAWESSEATTGSVKVSSDAANAIKSSKVSASGSSEKAS